MDVNELKYLNISGNNIHNTAVLLDWLGSSIEILDLSSNDLSNPDVNSFTKFINLKYLGIRDTNLTSIDFPFTRYNKKLEVLHLENNLIKRFDCNIFSLLLKSVPIVISSNNVAEIDTSCLRNSIKIIELNNNDDIAFRSLQSKSELRCKKINFQQLTYFNISANKLQNTPSLIDLLGPALETLDVSFNYVGKLTTRTFERITNLKYLNLSHTELSYFQFSTFYHQRRLITLDISYNHLASVNFTLFVRNFHDLDTLNLEGNDLIEIDSVTKSIFSRLNSLGISKNRFHCDYLANFLLQWKDVSLLDNPSNQTHIGGIDCHHNAGQQSKAVATATTTTVPAIEPKVTNGRVRFIHSTTEESTIKVSPDRKTGMDNGLVTRLDCNEFFDRNTPISCDEIHEIDLSCQENLIGIIVGSDGDLVFHSSQNSPNHRNRNEFRCTIKDLQYIKHLNVSGNQLENGLQLITMLGSSIEKLDMASNFIGKLNASTFQKFNRLEYLNLSRTNLSNFGFDTFFHQNKLKVLDLSYNHLKVINFTLFLLNFKNLRTLNLEGNDLMEIDTITRQYFPKLSLLGISQNNFSCDYLILFLRQWDNLQLMHIPSNQMHIGGIDCYSRNEFVTNKTIDVRVNSVEEQLNRTRNGSNRFENTTNAQKVSESHLSADVQVLKYLFMGICVIWCLNFIIKNKYIRGIRQNLNRNALERVVAYHPQRENDMLQSVELIENGSVKE